MFIYNLHKNCLFTYLPFNDISSYLQLDLHNFGMIGNYVILIADYSKIQVVCKAFPTFLLLHNRGNGRSLESCHRFQSDHCSSVSTASCSQRKWSSQVAHQFPLHHVFNGNSRATLLILFPLHHVFSGNGRAMFE